jgi:predicted glycosyltransferase
VEEAAHRERVLERLRAHFDALLVHADPRFTRLEEHFGATDRLPVPWAYTGFVTAGPPPMSGVAGDAHAGGLVVASAGGGAGALPLLRAIIAAFGLLRAQGRLADHRLLIFRGLHMDEAAGRALAAEARDRAVSIEPFAADFAARLASSALSVGQAGYNTCVELLATRVRAVLVPNPRMSDQRIRADRLASHGLAEVVDGDPPAVEALARAMGRALGAPRPDHAFDLDGVGRTRRLLEGLCLSGRLEDAAAAPALAAGGGLR